MSALAARRLDNIVSLARLQDPRGASEEVARLRASCVEHGFFYLQDHGVPASLVHDAMGAAQGFFALPQAVKCRFGQDHQQVHPKTSRGYVGAYGETLHAPSGPDCKQHFDLGIEAAPGDLPFTGPNVLPSEAQAPGFARHMLALQEWVMGRIFPGVLQAMAQALGQAPGFFTPHFARPTLIQRALYYPAGAGGAGMHTDNGIFTVLFQDPRDQGSLRAWSRGRWLDVPYREGALVMNLGDMLMKWSNGHFVSTPHQVVHRAAHPRLSIAFFIYPDIEARFVPLHGTGTIACRDVMLENFASIWQRGEGAGRARDLH
ncbi:MULTISPECIES: isopenicillin N synthase family dioxygenase [Pseudomonas]|uniref:isopenicillin N synthase family dioxygenase n=1 Tax=Pseudomonas TaxID=286 RepID=UPI0003B461DE|nr:MULTISPECIES: 2-oxoglutarate and iron-dependent oxygenase domain-containing protein [Pseudomonas]ERO60118.1 hypothetical protein P308_15620 [Pseudomonas piscis]POA52558.1 isopenicillin N synthase family oxygenase [Pseudomonas sp. FW507-12TSA]